jgi:hypothetical protein
MSTSYDGSLLDHLAEYMIYLSTASSFWFSLDLSYDHEFHLSKQFGMSPQDNGVGGGGGGGGGEGGGEVGGSGCGEGSGGGGTASSAIN